MFLDFARFCNLLVAHPCFGLVPFRCGSRVCPALEFFHLFFIMEAPCVLEWTIHVELGNFPEGTTVPDIAKLIFDFFTEDAQFSVVAIQQSQNRTTWVTFEDGGEAAKAAYEARKVVNIEGVECEVFPLAPRVERVLLYHFPYENPNPPWKRHFLHLVPLGILVIRLGPNPMALHFQRWFELGL